MSKQEPLEVTVGQLDNGLKIKYTHDSLGALLYCERVGSVGSTKYARTSVHESPNTGRYVVLHEIYPSVQRFLENTDIFSSNPVL